MARRRARANGFSLLELIIVLMVMVSLLAIAWPNLQRPLRRTSLSEAAQTLRSAIDDSRFQAITTGTPMFVQLRRGENVMRAGSFDSFMNAESDIAATGSPAPQPAALKPLGGGSDPHVFPSAIQSWLLPESIVISDVRWTLETPAEEFEPEVGSTADSTSPVAEVQSDSMIDLAIGASPSTWWLPLVATGQGRDAAIVLLDTSINEKITVTFASATGALEIVR